MTTAKVTGIRTLPQSLSHIWGRVVGAEKGSYAYWRTRILYSTILGYAAFYIVRQNLSIAMPGIGEEFGYSKYDIGWITTVFSITYGVGKLINGYFGDRSDARYFMPIGLFLSAIISFLMGFGSGLFFFILLWGINGCVQSMGWPACARVITHWFSPTELGAKWALCASSHQLGSLAIFGLGGILIESFGWRSVFIVPAFFSMAFSFFLFNRLRDTPKEVGLPPVEEYKGDVAHVAEHYDERITLKEVLTKIISNKLVWYMAIANTCLYIPRMGIFYWAPFFLKEYKGMTLIIAGLQLVSFEVASCIGGIFAGWLSDKVFNGRRGPVGAFCLIGSTIALYALLKIPAEYPLLNTLVLMLIGFLLNGSQVLNGVAAADFASKRAAGVSSGITGVVAYAGAAICSGAVFGKIVESYGWESGFMVFIFASLVGAFFFALTWNNRAKVLEDNEARGGA